MEQVKEAIALTIWWCEGTKKRRDKRWKNAYSYSVEVINTNPEMIRIFVNYLENKLNVSKSIIKGQLQIHENDNQASLEKYWLGKIGISKSQLDKTIIRPIGNKPKKNKGTFKLRIYSKELYLQLEKKLETYLCRF